MDAYELREMQRIVKMYEAHLGSGYARYCTPPEFFLKSNPANWEWVEKWSGGSVIFYGPEGTGKSSAARYLVCRHVTAMHDSTDWDDMRLSAYDLYAPDLEMATHDNSHDGAAALRRMIERAKWCGLLLLDDLDRAHWRDRGLDALRSIINHRHERKKWTFTTVNLKLDALMQHMKELHHGDADGAVSLMRRFRPAKGLEFTGESYRREMTA